MPTSPIAEKQPSVQPASLLFRSRMNKNEQRRQYKEYLASLHGTYPGGNIPFEVVQSYWTSQNDSHPVNVWSIVEPLRLTNEKEKEAIHQMRRLLADLIHDIPEATQADAAATPSNGSRDCCDTLRREGHKHCVSAHEALFIVYLATLSEERRRHMVMNVKSDASALIREELLKEADLIFSAIDVSDQWMGFER
jgi:hypothetical protein